MPQIGTKTPVLNVPPPVKVLDTDVEEVETDTIIPPPPPPISRDEMEAAKRKQKAAQLKAKRVLPDPPCKIGGRLTWDQMQEYLDLLTPDMWSHLLIYMYRTRPVIIRQLVDPDAKNYIDLIAQAPLNTDYVIANHGGGNFRFDVTDNDTKSKLFECLLTIQNVDPLLDYRELDINCKDNFAYIKKLQMKGIIDDKGQVKQNQANESGHKGSGGGTSDAVAMTREILGFVSTLTANQQRELAKRIDPEQSNGIGKGISDLLLERMRQDDPNKQLSTLSTLLAAMKDMFGGNNRQDQGISMMDIIKLMQESNNRQMEMFKLLMESRNTEKEGGEEKSGVSQMKEYFELFQMFKGGGGGHKSGWDVAIDVAEKVASPLLTVIGNVLALKAQTAGMPQPAPGVAQPSPVNTGGNSLQPPSPVSPQSGITKSPFDQINELNSKQPKVVVMQSPQPSQPSQVPNSTVDSSTQASQLPPGANPMFTQMLMQYGGLIISAMNNPDKDGVSFASDLVSFMPNGLAIHATICQVGPDTILETMKQVPEFWSQTGAIFGEAKIKTWIDEFINFQEYLREDTEEDNDTSQTLPTLPVDKPKGKGKK